MDPPSLSGPVGVAFGDMDTTVERGCHRVGASGCASDRRGVEATIIDQEPVDSVERCLVSLILVLVDDQRVLDAVVLRLDDGPVVGNLGRGLGLGESFDRVQILLAGRVTLGNNRSLCDVAIGLKITGLITAGTSAEQHDDNRQERAEADASDWP